MVAQLSESLFWAIYDNICVFYTHTMLYLGVARVRLSSIDSLMSRLSMNISSILTVHLIIVYMAKWNLDLCLMIDPRFHMEVSSVIYCKRLI